MWRKNIRIVLATDVAAILLALLVHLAWAQTTTNNPTPSPLPQTSTVLRTTTRLVQLNVIVEDGKGRPVLNLKKEDFSLLDESVSQEIAIFSPAAPPPEHVVANARNANVFDNREMQSGKSPAVSVILLDSLNTAFEDQVYAKEQVLKLLRRREPKEYLAIYYLSNDLYVLQDFTRDSQALLHAMGRLVPHASGTFDASTPAPSDMAQRTSDPGMALFDARVDRAAAEVAAASMNDRIGRTIGAFTVIANHLAYISGRKSLIWVSGAFPLNVGYGGSTLVPASADARSYSPEVDRAARALNRVNMSVYPVDAAGLTLSGGGYPGLAPAASLGNPFFSQMGTRDSMNALARATGGRAFYGTNDVAGAVGKAIEETEFTYLLGFYPNHNQWDGSFHRLKLRLKARGLQLRYRAGYFAAVDTPDQRGEMETDLARAAKNPVDSTSLHLRLTLRAPEAPPSHALRLFLRVDPRELYLGETKDGVRSGSLDLLFFQLGSGEKPLMADHKHVGLNLSRGEWEALLKTGLVFGDRLEVAPDAHSIRVFVRDSSGAMGSVTVPANAVSPAAVIR